MNAAGPLAWTDDEHAAGLALAMQQSVLWLVLDEVIGEMLDLGVHPETIRSMADRAVARRNPGLLPSAMDTLAT